MCALRVIFQNSVTYIYMYVNVYVLVHYEYYTHLLMLRTHVHACGRPVCEPVLCQTTVPLHAVKASWNDYDSSGYSACKKQGV